MDFRFLTALWITSMIVSGAGIGRAAEPAEPPGWVAAYSADLKNDKTAENEWWAAAGEAKITDGKMVLTVGKRGRFQAFLSSVHFPGSVLVEVTTSVSTAATPGNVNFDLQLNSDVPVGTNAKRGYTLQFRSPGNPCTLRRGERAIGSANNDAIRWQAGKSYQIVAEQNGGQVSVSVDGVPVLSVKDDRPLEGPVLNLVGLAGAGCTLSVEKFVVHARKDAPGDVIGPLVAPKGTQVTIKGPAMCARQCYLKQGAFDGCPYVAMYAIDGPPEIKAQFDDVIDKFCPERGLDADQAAKLLQVFDERLKYYLVPGPLVNPGHSEIDYPSHVWSVTGTVFEQDGKKWIAPSKIEDAKITYPARMLVPDKPFVMPEKEPLILKVTDTMTLKCIKIPPGRYMRGSPFYEHPRWQDEYPHEVVLTKPFYMAETPITQAMFEAVVGTNPSKKTARPWKQYSDPGFAERFRHKQPDDGPDFAVENATWAEIQKFCQALSEKNGRKVRVPAEGEWEYAARVGMSGPCFHEKYIEQRSYVADGEGRCEPVKRHKPNAWGLYDMVKSGWELVSDYKLDNVREKQVDPQGPSRQAAANHGSGPLRRTKGGSYYDDTHLNLHGACDESGNNEEGLMIFRVVVEAE